MPEKTSGENFLVIHYLTLRKAVGWLGVSLPAAMVLGNFLLQDCTRLQDTISHYYYTATGDLFVGILCGVALFLLSYKGYDMIDHIATSLAGVFAIGIALFPTNDNSADSCAVFHVPYNQLSNAVHYASAACFFIILACVSLFLFTKSKEQKTKEKKIRNKIYRTCGVVIFITVALIALYEFGEAGLSFFEKYKPVFWLEWVALFAFGMSWLVKGEIILQDA